MNFNSPSSHDSETIYLYNETDYVNSLVLELAFGINNCLCYSRVGPLAVLVVQSSSTLVTPGPG